MARPKKVKLPILKSALRSKTLWFNFAFLLLVALQWYADIYMADPDLQVMVVSFTNIVLRFATHSGIDIPKWLKRK